MGRQQLLLASRLSITRRYASAASTADKVKTALVLFNLGGPRNAAEVEPFLHRLFADPDLIPIPMQKHLAPWIAKRRSPKIIKQYAAIGGGSPILSWTRKQGDLLVKELDRVSPESAPHKAYIAFRYTHPLTADTVAEMESDGVQRAIGFTQYPQYSCSTTGSSLNELTRLLAGRQSNIQWSFIDRWPTHPGLVRAFVDRIQTRLEASYAEADRKNVVLMFSAHSLPMSVVNRGDTYPSEVAATVHAVMTQLQFSNPYRLVWQSQVGPAPWLGPRTDNALEGLAKQGIKNVMLIPIAFTSDHIETLFELDQEYGDHAKKLGVTGLTRCDSLNDHPLFIEALRDVAVEHIKSGTKHSRQLTVACPGCTKQSCRDMRSFICQNK